MSETPHQPRQKRRWVGSPARLEEGMTPVRQLLFEGAE